MSEEKKAFRARVRARVAALVPGYLAESDGGIAARLMALPEFQAAPRIFAYWSQGRECDTHAIAAAASAAGKTVALPVVLGDGEMAFHVHDGALRPGALTIPEPSADTPVLTPGPGDLMVVPALCCDGEGYRMGRGGGYYDRYLAAWRPFAVCLCREALLEEKVPREWNDCPVSAVITERRLIRA